MNSDQLRANIEIWLLRLHNEPELWEASNALLVIMESVKNHVEYVIGDDDQRFDFTKPDDLLKLDWQAKNDLRAEQRNRAGGY